MNKAGVVRAVWKHSVLTRAESREAVEEVLCAIRRALFAGEAVTLRGLGTFKGVECKARTYRREVDGWGWDMEKITVPAHMVVVFKPAPELRNMPLEEPSDG